MSAEDRLIVFVKLPVKGKVKTRLAKTVGDEAALALYRCFVADILAAVLRTGFSTLICFHPPHARKAVIEWLGDHQWSYLPQVGNNLGERMAAAFRAALRGYSRAVLIGSDCPDLPPDLLHEAFENLNTHDAVIGPAGDGGYYLIGFSSASFLQEPFRDMKWGTPTVFEDTMTVLTEFGARVHVLPPWNDIDEHSDLKALYTRHKGLPPGKLSTIDFLRDHLHW